MKIWHKITLITVPVIVLLIFVIFSCKGDTRPTARDNKSSVSEKSNSKQKNETASSKFGNNLKFSAKDSKNSKDKRKSSTRNKKTDKKTQVKLFSGEGWKSFWKDRDKRVKQRRIARARDKKRKQAKPLLTKEQKQNWMIFGGLAVLCLVTVTTVFLRYHPRD